MASVDAATSGTFRNGDFKVVRLGFGAMRIVGPGVWGEPKDRAEAIRVLRRVPDLGINLIDTADSYGPFVSEDLIAEALHPYKGLVIATKGGLTRHGPNIWLPVGRPEYLRQCVLMSLRRLKIDCIDLWQLHMIDKKVPRDEQFGVIAAMQKEGLIRHIGLSNVTVDDVVAARQVFPVVTVQNRYNLSSRSGEDVLSYCQDNNIGFIPWYPLAAGALAQPGGTLDRIAKAHRATAAQVAIAWLLKRGDVVLPIPGTGSVAHLEENTAAAALALSDGESAALTNEVKG